MTEQPTAVQSITDGKRRVVVGVDGSEPSKLALRWAALVALGTGDEIEAINAWSIPVNAGWAAFPPDWDPEQDAEKILSETVDEVFGHERPAGLTLTIREGYPAKVLLEASKGARMLVLGSRGHGGFVGMLLGSVSANCAEHATCPVLVVHGGDTPEDTDTTSEPAAGATT